MKILIAEDDPAFRQLLDETLTRWGYDTLATRNGDEAWQALQAADAPQIAILDWRMPGMEGVDICRRVRKELQRPSTYLILLTFQGREEDIVAGMEAGADDYILKPLKTNELRVRLEAGKRIIELKNELHDAQKIISELSSELDLAHRDLNRLSNTVATDLLTPLTTIGVQAQLLQEVLCRLHDDQCESFAQKIHDEATQLGRLTQDALGLVNEIRRNLKTPPPPTVETDGLIKQRRTLP